MNIDLIVDDESQSFRVRCFVDNVVDCVSELWVSVRCNANKDRPVIWERKWYIVFHNNLVEEDCDGKIVVAKSRSNLMLYMLTLENNGATNLRNNVSINGTIAVEETKWAIILRILFRRFINVTSFVQEYNHCELAQLLAIISVILINNIVIFVAWIELMLSLQAVISLQLDLCFVNEHRLVTSFCLLAVVIQGFFQIAKDSAKFAQRFVTWVLATGIVFHEVS